MNKQASVGTFAPTSTFYTPPASLQTAISATDTPATWGDSAVRALFMSPNTSSATSSATTTAVTTAQSSSSSDHGGAGLSGGAIGGIVVGAVLGLILAAGLIFLLIRHHKQEAEQGHYQSSQLSVDQKAELDAQGTRQRKRGEPTIAEMPGANIGKNNGEYRYRELDATGTARRAELPAEHGSAVSRPEMEAGRQTGRG